MIGRLAELADEETVITLVLIMGVRLTNIRLLISPKYLEETGFLVHKPERRWMNEKLIGPGLEPLTLGLVHIFINLQGPREPTGIVAAEDYKETQLEIIAALHAYKDEATGRHPFALALSS